jgi:hypothetical protein
MEGKYKDISILLHFFKKKFRGERFPGFNKLSVRGLGGFWKVKKTAEGEITTEAQRTQRKKVG